MAYLGACLRQRVARSGVILKVSRAGARTRSCHVGKMSDTVVAEGAAKIRDGKKVWKSHA